ncbi:hypothetical protein EOL96_00730 [Candidatus Saccharibacteria bacterium]|nr:hypothetical protein [Candidatus Saccharibacteria bacterium]
MTQRLSLLLMKLRLSAKSIGKLLVQWRYAVLAMVIAVLFFELIYWLFNASVLISIMTSPQVSISEKIAVLASPFEAIGQASGIGLLSLIISLAIVQGISIAALTFVIRHQKKLDDKLVSGSSFVTLLAIIGLGCPACGTSLITPIVALFVSGSAVAVSEQITVFVTPIALAIALYGLYVIGLRVANTYATLAHKKVVANLNVNDLQ